MNIIVAMPTDDKHKETLTACAPEANWFFGSDEVPESLMKNADVIIGNVRPELLKHASKLKWLQLNSAGTNGYTKEVVPEGVILTNATGAYGLAISEHMMASLLFLMKKIDIYSREQADHNWQKRGKVTGIYGTRTLVVGCGDIGCEFAKRMNAFGSHVTGIRTKESAVPEYMEAMKLTDDLYEELKKADIVADCLPGTDRTYRMFDRKAFESMKDGSYFINVGRGTSVDTDALIEALDSGHLAGACLDVTDPEPLPSDHPLWDAPNVLITPHVSGGYHMQITHDRIVEIAADNLKRFLNNEPLKNIVDMATGYRSR